MRFEEWFEEFLDFTDIEITIFREPAAPFIDLPVVGQDKNYFYVNGYNYREYKEELSRFIQTYRKFKAREIEVVDVTSFQEKIADHLSSTLRSIRDPTTTYSKDTYHIVVQGGVVGNELVPSYLMHEAIYRPFHNRAYKEILREKIVLLEGIRSFCFPLLQKTKEALREQRVIEVHRKLVEEKVITENETTLMLIFSNEPEKVTNKIRWLLTDKSGENTSKADLIYFLKILRKRNVFAGSLKDMLTGYFCDSNGNDFDKKNLSQSLLAYRRNEGKTSEYKPRNADLLDEILSSLE